MSGNLKKQFIFFELCEICLTNYMQNLSGKSFFFINKKKPIKI